MGRLFGTDGVRGMANREVTAELALDLAVAAAHVLGEVGEFAGHRPRAVVGRDPRASGEFLAAAVVAGLASAGVDVRRRGGDPHAGRRLPRRRHSTPTSASCSRRPTTPCRTTASSSSPRAGTSCPTSVEDAIETPHGRGLAAAHGCRRRPGPAARRRDGALRRPPAGRAARTASTASRSWSTAPTAPPAWPPRWRCGPPAPTWSSSAPSPTGSTSTTAAGRPTSGRSRRRWSRTVRTSASPTTATPTGAWPSTPRAGRSTATRSWAILALALRERGALREDTLVATVMSNLGLRAGDGARRGSGPSQTAVGDRYVLEEMRPQRLQPRRRAVRARRDARPRHDGRRHAHRAAAAGPDGQTGRPLAELASVVERLPQVLVNVPGVDKARADGDEAVIEAVRGRRGRPRGAPAGCSCGPRAPSRSCASWSRPPTPSTHGW